MLIRAGQSALRCFYGRSGVIYVYLCYGMHWLMNVITGDEGTPQGVLFRAGEGFEGPAKLTKRLGVTGELNLQSLVDNPLIWIEDDGKKAFFSYREESRHKLCGSEGY